MWRRLKKILMLWLREIPLFPRNPAGTEGEIRLKLLAKCKHGHSGSPIPTVCPIDVSARR
jgi:hypothetical protein